MIKTLLVLRNNFINICSLNFPFYIYFWVWLFEDFFEKTFNFNNIADLKIDYEFEKEFSGD